MESWVRERVYEEAGRLEDVEQERLRDFWSEDMGRDMESRSRMEVVAEKE
jgi:hypothetical protein